MSSLSRRLLNLCLIGGLGWSAGILDGHASDQGQRFLSDMYQAHNALIFAGQPGVIKTPGLPLAFFAPEILAPLEALDGQIHPLTGSASPKVLDVQVSADSNPDPLHSDHVVIVQGADGTQALRFSMIQVGGIFKIIDIAGARNGKAWALAPDTAPHSTAMTKADEPTEGEAQIKSDGADKGNVLSGVFSDAFDGDTFMPQWQVSNENRDAYILENGAAFFVVEGRRQMLEDKDPVNLISLPGQLPDTDYGLDLDFRLDAQTMEEHVMLGLRNETDDYLVADLYVRRTGCGPFLMLATHNRRQLREEEKAHNTRVEHDLFDGIFTDSPCGEEERKKADVILDVLREKGARLSLTRRGYRYQVTVELEFQGETLRYETPVSTRFEPMNNPVIHVGKEGGNPGTGTVYLDHFSYKPQM